MATSTFKGNSITEHSIGGMKVENVGSLGIGYFISKYLERGGAAEDLDY